jgi:hypothetical protein
MEKTMVKIGSLLFVSAAILGAACGGSSSSNPANNFAATLKGTSEVPATTSAATGTATFSVSGTTVTYTVTFTGLTGNPTASHMHVGSSSVAGPVVVPFKGLPTATAGTFTGTFTQADIVAGASPSVTTLDDLLVQMRAGNAYANVHTTANPNGEIRGQIQPN